MQTLDVLQSTLKTCQYACLFVKHRYLIVSVNDNVRSNTGFGAGSGALMTNVSIGQ